MFLHGKKKKTENHWLSPIICLVIDFCYTTDKCALQAGLAYLLDDKLIVFRGNPLNVDRSVRTISYT